MRGHIVWFRSHICFTQRCLRFIGLAVILSIADNHFRCTFFGQSALKQRYCYTINNVAVRQIAVKSNFLFNNLSTLKGKIKAVVPRIKCAKFVVLIKCYAVITAVLLSCGICRERQLRWIAVVECNLICFPFVIQIKNRNDSAFLIGWYLVLLDLLHWKRNAFCFKRIYVHFLKFFFIGIYGLRIPTRSGMVYTERVSFFRSEIWI